MSLRRAVAPKATALDAAQLRVDLEALAAVARRASATAVPIEPWEDLRPRDYDSGARPAPGPPEDRMLLRRMQRESAPGDARDPEKPRAPFADDLDGDGWVRGCNQPDLAENRRQLLAHYGYRWETQTDGKMIKDVVAQLTPLVVQAAGAGKPTFFIDGANMFGPTMPDPRRFPTEWHFLHGARDLGDALWRERNLLEDDLDDMEGVSKRDRGLCVVFLQTNTADILRRDMALEHPDPSVRSDTVDGWRMLTDERVPPEKCKNSVPTTKQMMPWQCFQHALEGLCDKEFPIVIVEIQVDGLAWTPVETGVDKDFFAAGPGPATDPGDVNYPRHNHGEIDDYILSRCFDKLYDAWYNTDESVLAYKHDGKAVPGINYRSPWSLSLFQIVSCDSKVYKGEKRDIYCAMSNSDNPDAVSEVVNKIRANRGIFQFIEYLTSSACSQGRTPDTAYWDVIMPRDDRNQYLTSTKDQRVAIRQRGHLPGAVRADVYYINSDPAHELRLPTDDDVRRWSHGKLARNCTPRIKREPGSQHPCHPAWDRDTRTLDEL